MSRLVSANIVNAARRYVIRKSWTGLRHLQGNDNDLACLRQLLPPHVEVNSKIVEQFIADLSEADFIRESIDQNRYAIQKSWDQMLSGKSLSPVLFCYVALRLLKPNVVVETGCFTGWTSTLMLLALHRNDNGHLWSIDIPSSSGETKLPDGLTTGFLVPQVLRNRWTLILGDARDHLMPVLQKQAEIDVFYHDSDHSYEHMMWEYTSIWPHLSPDGLLISDDIGFNTAFPDFADAVGRSLVIHRSNPNFGALSRASG